MAIVDLTDKMPLIIMILSDLFQGTAERNDEVEASEEKNRQTPSAAKAFSSSNRPPFSIQGYLEHIFYWIECSLSCYVMAYIYIDRFLYLNPSVRFNSSNAHRFLLTSILTSVKFMDGCKYDNVHFSIVGGIRICEMNELEVDFLFGLRFGLNVTPRTYYGYHSFLLGLIEDIEVPRMMKFTALEEDGSGLGEVFY